MSSSTRAFLLGPLLKGVSRSFYLTLRILPAGMRDPMFFQYGERTFDGRFAEVNVIRACGRADL